MSNSPSVLMSRPSLGSRSISELAPLYDPSSAPLSGPRLRGSKAGSGAHTLTGSQLPYSPLLPLPPASTSKLPLLRPHQLVDAEQRENVAPISCLDERDSPASPSALAARRSARRGVSEGYTLHSHQMKPNRTAVSPTANFSPKAALRLHIAAAADPAAHPAASKAAGMIRSYSLPVATQAEHDEQQRVMGLGASPADRPTGNPAWWQYGWPSPGGLNHRHAHKTPAAGSEQLAQRSRSSQTKLSGALSPLSTIVAVDTASVSMPAPSATTPRPSRPAKTHSSCSPKMKNKHLPGIHQHAFQSSSRSASTSPKMGRSPLAAMSTNLPSVEQQLKLDDETPLDIEMDALNQRFAEWSREQQTSAPSTSDGEVDDYFNLVHDEPGYLRAAPDSDTSDEARTPRASSPRPVDKSALHADDAVYAENRWSGSFDFIHPDHLS